MSSFALPPAIATLVESRNRVRAHYEDILRRQGSDVELRFTLDGNLVGDIGEALAAELFGITLVETKATEGFDGHAADGRSVQVKATGTGRGPVFRKTELHAQHLIFFCLNFEKATGTVIYNGPEAIIRDKLLPATFQGQRMVSRSQIEAMDMLVRDEDRLPRIR